MRPDPDRISPAPIGFRLAHELEGLLTGISADGVISDDESARVQRWLDGNERYYSIHPFGELADHLQDVLADGRIAPEECEDLLFVVRKFTTVNPYFDQLRGGLQVLMGLLAGLTTDRMIEVREARALTDWLDEWSHLKGLWPYEECAAIVTAVLARKGRNEDVQALLALAHQVPIAGDVDAGDEPPLLIRGVCAADPEIAFRGKVFVFTGESNRCGRSEMAGIVQELGGQAEDRVTLRTDYLVTAAAGSQFWAFSCYGRKVEQAYRMRRDGHHVLIVHEIDFWDAVAGQGGITV